MKVLILGEGIIFSKEHKEFENIFFISIQDKDFDINPDDKKLGRVVSLEGVFVVEDTDYGAEDVCGMHDYINVPIIKIKDGKISFYL